MTITTIKQNTIQKGSFKREAREVNGIRNRHTGASKALVVVYFLSGMAETHVQFITFLKWYTCILYILLCCIV